MKEIYTNINEECDAIDELCVICLERVDNNNAITVHRSKLLTCECDCRYYIHKSCFDKWMTNHTSEVSCLICLSKASPVLSCSDRASICVRSERYLQISRNCWNCFSWFICLVSVWVTLRMFEGNSIKYEG